MDAVTVVIPSYRRRDRISRAIESVLGQADGQVRVIVVVDDQCDATRSIALSHGDRVEVIFNDRNRGASYSRNAGLARAVTPYVMFLDSDDYLEGPLLSGICDRMAQSDADIGFGPTVGYNELTGQRDTYPLPAASSETIFSEWLSGTCYVPPCSLVWRTAFVRSIGGWDERLTRNDDAELALRGLLMGARICISRQGAGIYVYHEEAGRLSRSDDLASNLLGFETLLALDGDAIPRATVKHACAVALYELARLAFQSGDAALGRRALELCRRQGFRGHRGPALSRALSSFIGLRNTQRVRSLCYRRQPPISQASR